MPNDPPGGQTTPRFDEREDAELLAAVVRGEREALGGLFDRHAGLLLAFGMRLLGDRDRAEALLHDLFLSVWHQARAFDPTCGTVRAWLVARLRTAALAARSASSSAADATAFGLPAELSAVLELAYFDGASTDEIARRLGLPVGVARARLQQALAALRASLPSVQGARP